MKKRVLIVDDEVDLVETLKFKLEASGFEALTAYDGLEALSKAKNDKPDLILLDIMLPKLNGYQICRELKSDDKYKHIPIIMLTAKAQESDKFWGLETGADEYVTKPFDSNQLVELIKRHLSTAMAA